MRLNPDKTRIVRLTRGKQGFDLLGFHLRKVESWRRRGRCCLQRWPSQRAMVSVKQRIRTLTGRDRVGRSVDQVVKDLNLVLRGWGSHFRHGNSARKFAIIDGCVRERLAIFASRKRELSGRN